jgi:hypothetical protein
MATSVPALWIQGGFLRHCLSEKLYPEGLAAWSFPSNSPATFCGKRSGLKISAVNVAQPNGRCRFSSEITKNFTSVWSFAAEAMISLTAASGTA